MPGEIPSEQFEDLSELRKELEEVEGKIEEAPEPEVLEMRDLEPEEIEKIHEQREQVEKTTEASAELLVAMVSESKDPEEIKKIMEKVDRITFLAQAKTLETLPGREKPLEAVDPLGDEHKGVNSSYILRLIEKRISGPDGEEKVFTRDGVYKPEKGAASGLDYIRYLWDSESGRAWLESLGVKPDESRKLEDFFPGFDKESVRPGIERDSVHLREWLASMIDEALGVEVVPPTVLRIEKEGIGSVQEFARDATAHDKDPSLEIDDEEMVKMAFFDFVVGALDDHGGNYMAGKKLSGREKRKGHKIDNGYILSTDPIFENELDIISEPLEQFNPDRAEGGKVLDPTLPASLVESVGKFLQSEKIRGSLKKCFDITFGQEAEKVWQGFMKRVEKMHSEKKLPTKHNLDQGRVAISYRMGELARAAVRPQIEQAA